MQNLIKILSKTTIEKFAAEHIIHYKKLIRSLSSNVRYDECNSLIALWESILIKKCEDLNEDEASEIYSALTSGDYDHMLSDSEFVEAYSDTQYKDEDDY